MLRDWARHRFGLPCHRLVFHEFIPTRWPAFPEVITECAQRVSRRRCRLPERCHWNPHASS